NAIAVTHSPIARTTTIQAKKNRSNPMPLYASAIRSDGTRRSATPFSSAAHPTSVTTTGSAPPLQTLCPEHDRDRKPGGCGDHAGKHHPRPAARHLVEGRQRPPPVGEHADRACRSRSRRGRGRGVFQGRALSGTCATIAWTDASHPRRSSPISVIRITFIQITLALPGERGDGARA